jgi:2-hydroxychromene-2-carboxylate isomerase
MKREVEFLFDYSSPFSYLASLQIEGFAKRSGATMTYTPILLGAVLKATGNASPMTVPVEGHYMATELRRWSTLRGCLQTKLSCVYVEHAAADARGCGGTNERVVPSLPTCDLPSDMG